MQLLELVLRHLPEVFGWFEDVLALSRPCLRFSQQARDLLVSLSLIFRALFPIDVLFAYKSQLPFLVTPLFVVIPEPLDALFVELVLSFAWRLVPNWQLILALDLPCLDSCFEVILFELLCDRKFELQTV